MLQDMNLKIECSYSAWINNPKNSKIWITSEISMVIKQEKRHGINYGKTKSKHKPEPGKLHPWCTDTIVVSAKILDRKRLFPSPKNSN